MLALGVLPVRVEARSDPAPPMANPFDAELARRLGQARELAGRAEAVVPLLGVLDLWEQVDDRAALAALLDEVRDDGRQRAEVRARATFLRAALADRQGQSEEAERLRATLGLVTDWQIVGPFDDEGRAGDAKVYGPERQLAGPIDAHVIYPGKTGPVSWRRFPSASVAQGRVPLDTALRPDKDVLAYATSFVHVDRDVTAAVRTGSTGALAVWVDGAEVLRQDAYRPARLDQDAAAVRLRKGWNRVTVKLGAQDAGFSFYLRLTAPDGGLLRFAATADAAQVRWLTKTKRTPTKLPQVADLGRDLKQAADDGDARAALNYGLYLYYVAPNDPALGEAERTLVFAAQALGSTEAWRLAALAARDDEVRRRHLEQAVAPGRSGSKAERAQALTELGDVYLGFQRDRRAEELWKQALAEDAGWYPASVRRAQLAATRGLPSLAEARLEELGEQRKALAVLRARASLAEQRGRREEAERLYQELADASHDDPAPLRALFRYAKGRGDVAGALRLLDELARARPDQTQLDEDRAELLDAEGHGEEAHEVLRVALARCPDDAKLLERDGRVLHRLGRDDEALTTFSRALALRPQNPELRAYVEAIEATLHKAPVGDDLARSYAESVPALVAARAPRRPKGAAPSTNTKDDDEAGDAGSARARVLLDRTVVRMHQNGLSESYTQRVVEILDERGARDQGQEEIRYTPSEQAVQIKAARVYRETGEVMEAISQSDEDTSEPWYGLYYDTRAKVIVFPRLRPGDVIDMEYVVSDVGAGNLFGDYYGELHVLQEDLPRARSEFVLIAPRDRAIYYNEPAKGGAVPGFTVERSEKGTERIYRFFAVDVPKLRVEPGMPGYTSVAAYVHVSTFANWEELAEWYRGLVASQLEADDHIKQAVARATKGITDERQKIRALYDLVVTQTRYVGLEFGIHGYKPYPVAQVFQRKFGDCKDKASLLVTMLRLAGIDASLVLARTRRGGDLAPYPASLAPFDHAIAYVPKYDLFLDGTAEFSGSDELPAQDQDIPVLVVADPKTGGRGRLTRTPVLGAEKNRTVREQTVVLDADGAAEVTQHITVAGEAAHGWRSNFQAQGERRERYEQSVNASHPGAHVEEVELPRLGDLERPVELRAKLSVPAWAHSASGGKALAMPAFGHEGKMLRSFARLSERRQVLVVDYPWQEEERVRVVPPKGSRVSRLPEARHIETPFGSYVLTVEKGEDGEVRLRGVLTVTRHRVEPNEYAAFRRFCLDVDAALSQELVITHE